METLEYGPLYEQTRLSSGLDYYKPTMAQVAYEKHPDAQVTFEFKNRRRGQRLADYVDADTLRSRLERFQLGWQPDEISFLASQLRRGNDSPLFSDEFLGYLDQRVLPELNIDIDPTTNDIRIATRGDWPLVTFWETVVMSEVNELYFETYVTQNGLDLEALYDEGDRRLTQKTELLQSRPDIKFADFGTRRRFSYRWQKHVLSRLATECPENLIGTSNVWLAKEFDLMPIGTYAHEMPMVYAGLSQLDREGPLDGHRAMLDDWTEVYDNNLSTALTDTFTSDYFFADFTEEQAKHWQGLRHDSGDPIEFGEHAIAFFEAYGIDPTEKTIVFSDGLDIETIVRLADHFQNKIKVIFGWGTTLTNDLGIPALNIVMKATEVDGVGTVKLSDNTEKATGSPENIQHYLTDVETVVGRCAIHNLNILNADRIAA